MTTETTLPPAIVFRADTPIGLTIIRDLGEHGVTIHAVARSCEGIGLYSKWTTRGYLRPSDNGSTIELLNWIAAEHGAAFLLGIADSDLLLLRAAADAGRLGSLRALVPEAAQLNMVLDKSLTYAVAREVGVPVPTTWQPREGAMIRELPEELIFPCVLKWADPRHLGTGLSDLGIPFLKAEYCQNRSELKQALARYERYGRYPLVQEFCPGVGLGHMIFIHRGEALLRLQHRRISEWPPEGGVSTVCESLPLLLNAELFRKSETLLKRIGWQGAAMVEYRLDHRTGRASLMEINGRFWGSLPLAYRAGAPFAWYTYAVLGLGMRPDPPRYRPFIRCRYMMPETRRILAVIQCRGQLKNREFMSVTGEIFAYALQFFSPRSRYYVLTLRDPVPFLADIVFATRRVWRRFIRSRSTQSMRNFWANVWGANTTKSGY
ncbi:MAG: carboxylate--amine ligase [Acidobacteria bacterium]|nr:carboxylate--amine ligase [Acidobacteriota bacterium]